MKVPGMAGKMGARSEEFMAKAPLATVPVIEESDADVDGANHTSVDYSDPMRKAAVTRLFRLSRRLGTRARSKKLADDACSQVEARG